MHRPSIPFAVALTALILLTGACGQTPAAQERFEDATASSVSRWRDTADAIMADGRITRAETEQAFSSYVQCMEEQGFVGEWSIDLDTHYWGQMTYGLNPQTRGYQPLPERFRKVDWTDEDRDAFSIWLNSAEGRERERDNQRIADERRAACAPFDEVQEMAASAVDWSAYDRAEFDAIVRCITTNAPRYADRAQRVEYAFSDTRQGVQALHEEFSEETSLGAPKDGDERRVGDCFINPNGVPTHHFGPDGSNDGSR